LKSGDGKKKGGGDVFGGHFVEKFDSRIARDWAKGHEGLTEEKIGLDGLEKQKHQVWRSGGQRSRNCKE